jgi:hypothetical protein
MRSHALLCSRWLRLRTVAAHGGDRDRQPATQSALVTSLVARIRARVRRVRLRERGHALRAFSFGMSAHGFALGVGIALALFFTPLANKPYIYFQF